MRGRSESKRAHRIATRCDRGMGRTRERKGGQECGERVGACLRLVGGREVSDAFAFRFWYAGRTDVGVLSSTLDLCDWTDVRHG